jgi:hypothetical protein
VDLQAGRFALTRDIAQALLDRRFQLSRWLAPAVRRPGEADSDSFLARQAVVEGDATTLALELLDPQGSLLAPRALAEITDSARDALLTEKVGASPLDLGRRLFAALDGLAFIAEIRARAPWSTVDQVWRRPPQSTEQILHPEKYRRHESPDDVGARLPGQLRGGWRVSYRDTLGELGTRLFLARAVLDYRAQRAASGWGGDRALLLRRGEPPSEGSDDSANAFAAWITTWDDVTDAEDFAGEASFTLVSLAGLDPQAIRSTPGHLQVAAGTGRLYLLERRGRTVGMLFGAPALAQKVLSELMSAAEPRPGRRAAGRRYGRARAR